MTELVLIDQPAEGVTRLTLNRPDKLNALTLDLVNELYAALDAVDADHDCRAVILTGAGKGFCAGLDLNGFGTVAGTEKLGRVQKGMHTQQLIADVVHRMRDVRQPIISAINGAAAGGGFAFACASDIRYAGESAKFGTAFVRLGLSGCDIGVSWMLPRLIGASRAWELLLTGRVFDAAEADRIGLISRVVPDEALTDTVLEVAAEIARQLVSLVKAKLLAGGRSVVAVPAVVADVDQAGQAIALRTVIAQARGKGPVDVDEVGLTRIDGYVKLATFDGE